MHITSLSIRNFRNFSKARFRFAKGVNTLVGENGSGKSNALHAIRLLLDEGISRRDLSLAPADFCRQLQPWKGHWIVLQLAFAELDPSEGCQFMRHQTGHVGAPGEGTLTYLFRPRQTVRHLLFDAFSNGGPDAGKAEAAKLSIDDYEPVFTGRALDLVEDDPYLAAVGDPAAGSFTDPNIEDVAKVGVRMYGMQGEVVCTFVKALRDVVADLRSTRSSPLLAVLRGKDAVLPATSAAAIVGRVKQLNDDIAELPEIKTLAAKAQGTLHGAVGRAYAPDLRVASELPEEMERLLQHLALRAGDTEEGYQGSISELGLGGANLIYLALKLLEYGQKQGLGRAAHFLLIEEPEAHIHPHIQKTLFDSYLTKHTQVIVSSHSTHLSSVARITSMNILARSGGSAAVFSPAVGLTTTQVVRAERYLDAVRSTLLFARGVVLVEGDAEAILLPSLIRAVFGISLDELGLSLVSVGGAVFFQLAPLFAEDRIRRPCAVVTDLDQPIRTAAESAALSSRRRESEKRAARLGKRREKELLELAAGSKWIRPCFAQTTFEVELLRAGNTDLLLRALPEIYPREAVRRRAEGFLSNPLSAKAAEKVLAVASQCGKGWFALLLATHVDAHSRLPDYMLDAIAFAGKAVMTAPVLKAMGEHRCHAAAATVPAGDAANPAAYLDSYAVANPNDPLTRLLARLRS